MELEAFNRTRGPAGRHASSRPASRDCANLRAARPNLPTKRAGLDTSECLSTGSALNTSNGKIIQRLSRVRWPPRPTRPRGPRAGPARELHGRRPRTAAGYCMVLSGCGRAARLSLGASPPRARPRYYQGRRLRGAALRSRSSASSGKRRKVAGDGGALWRCQDVNLLISASRCCC